MIQFPDLNTIFQAISSFLGSLKDNIQNIDSALTIVVSGLTIPSVFSAFMRKRSTGQRKKAVEKFIVQNYGIETKRTLNRYYIKTRGQDIDPCYNEEIREDNNVFFSLPLVSFFMNTAFTSTNQAKYYLVLADSGMGKTTFLLDLYSSYCTQRKARREHNMEMIPLSRSNAITLISDLKNKENTILLLDALDENLDAMNDYKTFFQKLLEVTEGFYCVIVTCRTQFFPNTAAEPLMTGRIKTGVGNKSENIVKKYISPFSDEQVQAYLQKRYRFKRQERIRASEIVRKTPSLMARPIILNWVDFLQNTSTQYAYTYQIYKEIIDKWIEREELDNKQDKLFSLSFQIAENMFQNKSTFISGEIVDAIAAQDTIDLKPIIAKSRSLLNRNGDGQYKFAHRSFLEYFMAYSVFQDMALPADQSFFMESSNARLFLIEMLVEAFWEKTDKVIEMEQVLSKLIGKSSHTNAVDTLYVRSFMSSEMQLHKNSGTTSICLGLSLPHIITLNSIYNSSDFYIKFTRNDTKDIVVTVEIIPRLDIETIGGEYVGELSAPEILDYAKHLNDPAPNPTNQQFVN